MDKLNQYAESLISLIMGFAPKVITAIVVLIVGFWMVSRITGIIRKYLDKSPLTPEISTFLGSLLSLALKLLVIFIIAGIVGIETTSFVALLAAAGFAIGMALQGSLGNFAAGIIILLFKPYRVGDWVSVKDKFGKVTSIQIFNTIVETPGQNLLIIPNGQVIEDVVTNYSAKGFVRIELEVTIPYSEDYPEVEALIKKTMSDLEDVLEDPAPEVGILDFDTHSIIIAVRPYCVPDNYWKVRFNAYAAIKRAFSENYIQVAYSEGVELGRIGR